MSVRPDGPVPSTAEPAKIPRRVPAGAPRAVWTAVICLAATIVAAAAGLLSYAGGAKPPVAVLTAGGAFAGTVLLFMAVVHFLSGDAR